MCAQPWCLPWTSSGPAFCACPILCVWEDITAIPATLPLLLVQDPITGYWPASLVPCYHPAAFPFPHAFTGHACPTLPAPTCIPMPCLPAPTHACPYFAMPFPLCHLLCLLLLPHTLPGTGTPGFMPLWFCSLAFIPFWFCRPYLVVILPPVVVALPWFVCLCCCCCCLCGYLIYYSATHHHLWVLPGPLHLTIPNAPARTLLTPTPAFTCPYLTVPSGRTCLPLAFALYSVHVLPTYMRIMTAQHVHCVPCTPDYPSLPKLGRFPNNLPHTCHHHLYYLYMTLLYCVFQPCMPGFMCAACPYPICLSILF